MSIYHRAGFMSEQVRVKFDGYRRSGNAKPFSSNLKPHELCGLKFVHMYPVSDIKQYYKNGLPMWMMRVHATWNLSEFDRFTGNVLLSRGFLQQG